MWVGQAFQKGVGNGVYPFPKPLLTSKAMRMEKALKEFPHAKSSGNEKANQKSISEIALNRILRHAEGI